MTHGPEHTLKRINNRLGIAREGFPFIGIGVAATLISAILGLEIAAAVLGALTLFTIYFFRDPERVFVHDEKSIVSPADGRILSVLKLDGGDNPLGEPATKISIFMSVFNVHVNRIPTSGKISGIRYSPGRFFSANLDKASAENEHNRVTLQTMENNRVVFVQIAGLIARRIACWIQEGDEVRTGQRFGLIRFGSRVDVYLPRETRVVAGTGERVKAGKSILGYMP